MSGAVVAVTQWLVRATDDRAVTASNLVRLPHIACVFRRHNKPSVPSIMVSMMGDVNMEWTLRKQRVGLHVIEKRAV